MSAIRLDPIFKNNGDFFLFDIFVDEKWIGSARTEAQAWQRGHNHANRHVLKAQIEAQHEQEKQQRKETKEKHIQELKDAAPDTSEVDTLIYTLFTEEKLLELKSKPKMMDWFIAQVLKQSKIHPVVIKERLLARLRAERVDTPNG